MSKTLNAALEYLDMGMSVIPVGQDKRPLIKWERFQREKATVADVQEWFKNWPTANIGVVTGKISDLLVVDADTQTAVDKVQSLIPENVLVPIQSTPKGGRHFFFKHKEGLVNRARVAEGLDIRTTGGFIVMSPSVNGNGRSWQFLEGLSIKELGLIDIIDSLYIYIYSLSFSSYAGGYAGKGGKQVESVTDSHKPFEYGRRDEDLFHAANIMVKGGGEPVFIYEVLERIILSWGENPDKKWIEAKIKSALDRVGRKERNITDEIREWAQSQPGHFLVTECHKELGLVTSSQRHTANVAFRRLEADEHLIEKYGEKRGCYRLIDRTLEIQDWRKAKGKPLSLRFPLGVEQFVKIFPGNIILLEGQKSQGKSSFAIEFCRLNAELFKESVLYQNVEMSDDEFLERFESYGELSTVEEWEKRMTIIRQSGGWWDKVLPDGLNIIDYLVEYKESYLIAEFVFKIHQRLKNGIALVLVQRDPYKPYPAGGRGVRDIPRLILSLIHHKIKIEDVKSFKKTDFGNPSGLVKQYKQASWWHFLDDGDWHKEEEEKYTAFMGKS